jgi:hypothetical protein
MSTSSASDKRRRLTKRELSAFLTAHGYPTSVSTLDKLLMSSRNEGPRPAGMWGNRLLFDPDEALAWAERRFRARDTAA